MLYIAIVKVDNVHVHQLIQEIKEWKHGYWDYLKYSYKLTLWLYLGRYRRLERFIFRDHFDIVLRSGFVLLGLVSGLLIFFFGDIAFTQEVLSNYLVAIGAMSGGAIAIVFTISIFMLQSAADLYSSQYFEVYIHDWKEKVIYFLVIIITILFFGGGLYVGGMEAEKFIPKDISAIIVIVSLFLVGIVFALIDWQYKTVRQKINPAKALSFLEKQAIKFLDRVQTDAHQIADVMTARDKALSKNEAVAKTYNLFLKPQIDNLDRQLENIIEISLKLSDKQEVGTTKRGINAFHNVLAKYLEIRKTSSVAMASGIAFLAVESDSQRFLFDNFDRLNKAGEKLMKEGKDDTATYILRIYESLATKAKDITFIGRAGENPILGSTIIGCFEQYIDLGMRYKNLEVVFQSIDKLGNIGLIASEVGLDAELKGIQDKLLSIAMYGIREKQTIITDQCNLNIIKIIGSVFASKKIIARHQYDTGLKHIATIAQYIFVARQAGHLSSDFGSSFALTKGYDGLYELIIRILNYYGTLTDDRDKRNYRSDITHFFDELYRSLRTLSEDLKHCDNLLTESIGRLLFNVNDIIIQLVDDPEFSDQKNELLKQLSWNIHLPSWFANHSVKFDAGTNNFRSLNEAVAKTGVLVAEKLQDKKLVIACIHSLGSMTDHALEKGTDNYGYDEPRLLEKACYLGILALKKGWKDVFAEVAVQILNFNPKYEKKHFSNIPAHIDQEKLSPRKDQLYVELMRWRDEFDHERMNRMLGIRDDAQAMMYPLVEVADIDWFIYRVWHKWSADSPINDAIEKEIAEANAKKKAEQQPDEKAV